MEHAAPAAAVGQGGVAGAAAVRTPDLLPTPPPGLVPGPGRTLPTGVAAALSGRLGFDVGEIRIHTDSEAASANRRLGSLAHSVGDHVLFAADAYAPHTTDGQALLAHEIAHVAQQRAGRTDAEEVLEREAGAAEAGAALGPWARTHAFSSPRIGVHLRPGDAVSITVEPHPDGTARFTATLEGGGTATAGGTCRDLPAGAYWAQMRTATLILTHDDGSPMPRSDLTFVPDNAGNRAFLRAVTRTTDPMRFTVTATAAASGGGGGATAPDQYADQRRQLDELPDRIRAVLFSSDTHATPPRPEDYTTLLRIAAKLATLTEEELAEYAERTTRDTTDATAFESSVDAFVARMEARRATLREADDATAALTGMDQVYEMYRSWQAGLLMGGPPSWIAGWEAQATADLPATAAGTMNELYLRMRRAMDPYGYRNLAAFETALARFLAAFRETAMVRASELLDRYEHVLRQERERYSAGGAALTSLNTDLAGARTTFSAAEVYRRDALAAHSGWDPESVSASYAAGAEYRRRLGAGRAEVHALADTNPVLGYTNAPVDELARTTDEAGTGRVLTTYIDDSLTKVASTRDRLRGNHEIVFRLDTLVARTKAQLGIDDTSIWAKIITDHQAPTLDDVERDLMLGVLGLALGVASGGSAVAAVAALGLSSYMALQTYEDYALRNDAYGAQLLSEEPSLAWVVLAVVAVVADLAVVASVIRPIRPALQAFQRTGDIGALEAELSGVEESIRRSILARAELELRARGGWDAIWAKVVPPGAARASVFGLDLLAEQLGKVVYSIQLNLRRGFNTFTRWRLTREATDLIGEMNALTPAQLARVRQLYSQGVENLQRITSHGRRLGMTAEEVEAAVQGWAQRGTGTVDDVLAEMTASRAGRPATTGGAWTPPKSWNGPANHGRWSGVRGNSGWIDDRESVIRIVGRQAPGGEANPIPFHQGEIDFGRWAQGEVQVPGLVGDHATDMARIRLAIAERQGLVPDGSRTRRIEAALEWLRNADDGFGGRGLAPHHAGGNRVQLVPKDLHRVQHTDVGIYDID
ncbi:eCIS core domain-containing protein [Actinopolymorpha rutila]|uniref:eCIS core domain-containing protein n=1 Tax=Actinopolymorpha rutila TaxID=446787 RepID=UPI0015CA1184